MWQQVNSALSQSAHRVLFKLASFLPGLVAFLLAVLLLTAIGAGLAALLRRILVAVRFDERLSRSQAIASITNIQDWSPSHSPAVLLTRLAFWGCVLLGLLLGLSAFDASYSNTADFSVFLLPYLTHSVGAILILVIGNLAARFLSRSVLIGAVNARLQYARFLSLGVKWMVLVVTTAMILDHLQIGGSVVDLSFGILFGGIVLTLSLAIGLGSKELVSRSIEKTADLLPDTPTPFESFRTHPPASQPADEGTTASTPVESLRHF